MMINQFIFIRKATAQLFKEKNIDIDFLREEYLIRQSAVQAYFRDKHNIYVEVSLDQTSSPKFAVEVIKYTGAGEFEKFEQGVDWSLYRTYEEALEIGLQIAIKLLP